MPSADCHSRETRRGRVRGGRIGRERSPSFGEAGWLKERRHEAGRMSHRWTESGSARKCGRGLGVVVWVMLMAVASLELSLASFN